MSKKFPETMTENEKMQPNEVIMFKIFCGFIIGCFGTFSYFTLFELWDAVYEKNLLNVILMSMVILLCWYGAYNSYQTIKEDINVKKIT